MDRTTSAEDLTQQLPDDLLDNVFRCLRTTSPSLAASRCVCKAWRHLLLHDPVFTRVQAQCPSPASGVLARFHQGRLEVLTPGAAAAAVAPPPIHRSSTAPHRSRHPSPELAKLAGAREARRSSTPAGSTPGG